MMEPASVKYKIPDSLGVYVACPSADISLAREMFASIRAAGYIDTYDWTAEFKKNHDALLSTDIPRDPEEAQRHEKAMEALFDSISYDLVRGVRDADVVVFMHMGSPSAGAWAELGLAIADNTPVIVYIPSWSPGQEREIHINPFLNPAVCNRVADAYSIYEVIQALDKIREKKSASS